MTNTHEEDSPQPPYRFALVNIIGKRASSEDDTVQRVTTLLDIAMQVHIARWEALDAVILPKGFFYLGEYIGGYDFKAQRRRIHRSLFHPFVGEALEILARWSPNAFIIAGVDTAPPPSGTANQPLHIAWDGRFVMSIRTGDYRKPPHYRWLHTLPVTRSITGEAFFARLCEAPV